MLTVPGYTGSGPQHWQSLWEARIPGARRVQQRDWDRPELIEWVAALDAEIAAAAAPPLLVAHSLGCLAVVHWAARHPRPVAGALLVAPADAEAADALAPLRGFAPIPRAPLPFPSILVASDDDPFLAPGRARELAAAWGSRLAGAGAAGHLNTVAGYGPWPAGEALLAELAGGPLWEG